MSSKAIVFDFDDTIYPEADYFQDVFFSFCSEVGWPKSAYEDIIKNFRHYRLTKKNIFSFFLQANSSIRKTNREPLPDSVLLDRLFEIYTSIETNLTPYDEAESAINIALNNGFKVGVLTNGVVNAQINKWKCLSLAAKSEISFIPARVTGADKPNPMAFEKMQEMLGVVIERTVYVGDQFKNDIEYPLNAGGWGVLIADESIQHINYDKYFRISNISSLNKITRILSESSFKF
jgi:putative hydrolase of the HAD superfamily